MTCQVCGKKGHNKRTCKTGKSKAKKSSPKKVKKPRKSVSSDGGELSGAEKAQLMAKILAWSEETGGISQKELSFMLREVFNTVLSAI